MFDKCSIIDRETRTIVAVGIEDHGLYRLEDTSESPELTMAARNSSISSLWQQHYGHLNVHYLSQLSREGLVAGLPEIQTQHLEFVELVRLGSNTGHRSRMVTHGEPQRYYSWFKLMYVGLWIHLLLLVVGISCFLLMILVVKCGCNFLDKN